ncbi:MAG: DUF58 domain-containing protein [Chloroflexi bacterium]|nr:DUF58 domain-containing protein [Chloroflexota bacterium]MCH7652579.1 DUF58 domain-containing protein [Chloroflexota bacterium]
MVVAVFTGASTGFGLFYRLFYILGLTLILSYIWNWMSLRKLEVEVERRTHRARVGDMVEERITLRNRSRLPKPTLEAEDLTDLPGYSSGMAVSLTSNSFRSWRTQTPARKRGVYRMGPVRVSNTDVFGIFRRERHFCGTDSLIVYPRTYDIPGFVVPPARLSGESSTRRRTHDLTPHASSVRDYAPGDSISRVHWPSTARLGRLMSKEFDLGQSSDVWIFVDLHMDVQAGELEESTDEYAVTIAASLAGKYLEQNLPVGLIAFGDRRYFLPAETGAGQFDRIMEYLAMSKAEGTTALESALPREEQIWGYHSSLIVITPSNRPEWAKAIREITKRRVRVAAVLVDGQSFGGLFETEAVIPHLYEAGVAPYLVRRGDDIPVALDHVYTSSEPLTAEELEEAEVIL